MDDLKKISQAFVQAASMAGPTSYIPEVTGYNRAGSMENAVKRGISASGALSGQKAQEADAMDEAARKEAMRKIADKLDPGKYSKQRKADGGFDFIDAEGKKIDVDKYSQITGQRIVDVLKDSENPVDQEYVNDYSNMNDLAQAMYNGDSATIEAFMQQNPDLKGSKVQDLMTELIRKYPHLYGRGSYQQTLEGMGSGGFKFNGNAPAVTGPGGGGWSPS